MIDEDVFDTEDDCRPDNGVGDSGSDDGLFDLGLSIEVWKRRIQRRIGDADVHDSAYTRFFGRSDQCLGIFHGPVEGDLASGEPHPVGVL